jgi:hypothetical protein
VFYAVFLEKSLPSLLFQKRNSWSRNLDYLVLVCEQLKRFFCQENLTKTHLSKLSPPTCGALTMGGLDNTCLLRSNRVSLVIAVGINATGGFGHE